MFLNTNESIIAFCGYMKNGLCTIIHAIISISLVFELCHVNDYNKVEIFFVILYLTILLYYQCLFCGFEIITNAFIDAMILMIVFHHVLWKLQIYLGVR